MPLVVGTEGEHVWSIAGHLLVGTKHKPHSLDVLISQEAVDKIVTVEDTHMNRTRGAMRIFSGMYKQMLK